MKVLIIGYVWPEPKSSAAGRRTLNLIDILEKFDHEVVFFSPSKENDHSQALRERGIHTDCVEANDPNFDRLVGDLQPDLVIFDRFIIEEQFAWRVQEKCPGTMRILDTQDLHFLRRGRHEALTEGKKFNLNSQDAQREVAAIYRSDLTLLISDFEMSLLQEELKLPRDLLHLIRFCYPKRDIQKPFSDRENFVWIGNYRHAPNLDSIKQIHSVLWPKIHEQLPQSELHVFGAYPPKEVVRLDDAESGFRVFGWTPNQFETLARYRVNLAPLRFGAGIKGKITDGWWAGTPNVTTAIGAEGMAENLPWGGFIAEDPDAIAAAATVLYTNPKNWQIAHDNGNHILDKLYQEGSTSRVFMNRINDIRTNLDAHRKSNFTGAMLWHHSLQSTKYMSKWIEAKNRF